MYHTTTTVILFIGPPTYFFSCEIYFAYLYNQMFSDSNMVLSSCFLLTFIFQNSNVTTLQPISVADFGQWVNQVLLLISPYLQKPLFFFNLSFGDLVGGCGSLPLASCSMLATILINRIILFRNLTILFLSRSPPQTIKPYLKSRQSTHIQDSRNAVPTTATTLNEWPNTRMD